MTTPSSSTTTPSPPMAYLQAQPLATLNPGVKDDIDTAEREERQRAIQKFLARAEISKLTRGLRARLSYATYKATHNMSRASLGDLESHPLTDSASATWAPARTNYYDNPATQGNSAMNVASGGSQRRGSMAPPTVIPSSASRTHYPQSQGKDIASANATQSLYASILAPPPAKRARTIHNPEDPPLPAPDKMANGTPRQRKGSHASGSSHRSHSRTASGSQSFSSVAERTRAQAKTKKDEPSKRKGSSKKDKAKRREVATVGAEHDVDIDMKAAATLTSLLRQRSSITVGATSPRSSISAGSDAGSAQSFSQFAQSSTRTTSAATLVPSAESSFMTVRPETPPRSSDLRGVTKTGSEPTDGGSAPASATDQEAVKLLYFLHESPSPARPSTARNRNAQDAAAYHALGGSVDLQAKGRVLFPTSGGGSTEGGLAQRMLARENTGSVSSISSVLTDSPAPRPVVREPTLRIEPPEGDVMPPRQASVSPLKRGLAPEEGPTTKITPPTPTDESPAQLLPPPPSPQPRPAQAQPVSSVSPPSEPKAQHAQPVTPGTFTFNLNDFINVSPSPAPTTHRPPGSLPPMLPGLRAGTGRKLFQAEQDEPMMGIQEESRVGDGGGATLGAGIHLTHF